MLHAKYIAEETAAHGRVLAFPNVSSCVAVVVVLPDELVGWHVTLSTLASVDRSFAAQGAAKFRDYASTATSSDRLLIVGHVTHHDPVALRNWVQAQLAVDLPTQSFDITRHRKAESNVAYHLFFEHNGHDIPQITFKNSTKVGVSNLTRGESGASNGGLPVHNRSADFTVSRWHRLRRHFVNV
ncbi:hypothetical protein VDF90_07630 [Xanthomonas campestris pv. raphani]|jgi:hypothetical protein|uniref:hypothetical protein n=1 Tax=Xanthomonas TaxID=338 RepID=UPI000E0FE7AB|nr:MULTISPECIES: hypothetical protein [Xanthomonas]MCW2039242.1 hypothetical protein [Xanthomonas campestris]MEA0736374.1 hypothetical protein [Xanthomonas campestris pv. campestris]MEA9787120.1 hypothetical protein [Xanthomonas campestris pv. raphani]MEA9828672.1 hypothetical protein [Xanthomonas campestris pv. raphani]MEB1550306.1 hypothetical protein [Xanthomonas campestris pv. campestris]